VNKRTHVGEIKVVWITPCMNAKQLAYDLATVELSGVILCTYGSVNFPADPEFIEPIRQVVAHGERWHHVRAVLEPRSTGHHHGLKPSRPRIPLMEDPSTSMHRVGIDPGRRRCRRIVVTHCRNNGRAVQRVRLRVDVVTICRCND
jgi:hypothetical protein